MNETSIEYRGVTITFTEKGAVAGWAASINGKSFGTTIKKLNKTDFEIGIELAADAVAAISARLDGMGE